jgi:peptidoglycan hydrolase CwlO-like protein
MNRAVLIAAVLALATALTWPSAGSADLQGQLNAAQSREKSLQIRKAAQQDTVSALQARINDLDTRVAAIQVSLDNEKSQLFALRDQLRAARLKLGTLRESLTRGRAVLAKQLRAQYIDPPPDVVALLVNATSFSDLLEAAEAVKRIQARNVRTLDNVTAAKRAVTTQARRLSKLENRQQQITAAVLVQRNQVAALARSTIARQERAASARDQTASTLSSIRARRAAIEKKLQAQLAPVVAPAPGGGGVTAGGPQFAAHGGSFGFFQAPGTNYSVGDEPEIARRLDRLGKTLHLHLIGISGYRSPQHSVEVGGFADDPHTKGQASDTPGVEGVSEATLNSFGLTRPFGGAAEADHIQLAGSI